MGDVRELSYLHKNYVANCLRKEIDNFQELLQGVEESEECEAQHIREALRASGKKIHSLNKSLANLN